MARHTSRPHALRWWQPLQSRGRPPRAMRAAATRWYHPRSRPRRPSWHPRFQWLRGKPPTPHRCPCRSGRRWAPRRSHLRFEEQKGGRGTPRPGRRAARPPRRTTLPPLPPRPRRMCYARRSPRSSGALVRRGLPSHRPLLPSAQPTPPATHRRGKKRRRGGGSPPPGATSRHIERFRQLARTHRNAGGLWVLQRARGARGP
mmetsp:Transcript_9927/g.30440  ORF Transcript_9927/g.30440 Transcript_9927/m.30440 type:complete len:202 (+) Transcript_9927:1158-1763(+)|eukprot:scaffold23107_cov28-Tisochrysis_lutea.AAC.6